MNVSSVSGLSVNMPSAVSNDKSVDQDYAAMIAQFYDVKEYKSADEINADDSELKQFKEDLITKGASAFLKDLNEEKIEAMVEEYRQKLLKEKEQNPDQPMDINQMVSDFRKQLIKEIMDAQKTEQANKSVQSGALMSGDILENIKNVQNDEKKSAQPEVGFLEQILSSSNTQAKKNEKLIF